MHSNVLTLLALWLYAMSAGTSIAFPYNVVWTLPTFNIDALPSGTYIIQNNGSGLALDLAYGMSGPGSMSALAMT